MMEVPTTAIQEMLGIVLKTIGGIVAVSGDGTAQSRTASFASWVNAGSNTDFPHPALASGDNAQVVQWWARGGWGVAPAVSPPEGYVNLSRVPHEILRLEERLRNRLESGLIAHILSSRVPSSMTLGMRVSTNVARRY